MKFQITENPYHDLFYKTGECTRSALSVDPGAYYSGVGGIRYIGVPESLKTVYRSRFRLIDAVTEIDDGIWVVPHSAPGLEEIGSRHGQEISLYTREELEQLTEDIAPFYLQHSYTGHCTGRAAYAMLKELLGEMLSPLSTGIRFTP